MERAAMQENEKAGDHASDSSAFLVSIKFRLFR